MQAIDGKNNLETFVIIYNEELDDFYLDNGSDDDDIVS